MTDRRRWRNVLTAWASRRYKGRHRTGTPFAQIAARVRPLGLRPGEWLVMPSQERSAARRLLQALDQPPADECVTQIIPTPNVVPHVEPFDLPTIEFPRVPAWTVTL